MKIPYEIRLLGTTYRVRRVSKVEAHDKDDRAPSDEGPWGYIDFGAADIQIKEDLSEVVSRQVLWHEMVHLIDSQLTVKLSDKQTDRIAHGIDGLLVQNPSLLHIYLSSSTPAEPKGWSPPSLVPVSDSEGGEI